MKGFFLFICSLLSFQIIADDSAQLRLTGVVLPFANVSINQVSIEQGQISYKVLSRFNDLVQHRVIVSRGLQRLRSFDVKGVVGIDQVTEFKILVDSRETNSTEPVIVSVFAP